MITVAERRRSGLGSAENFNFSLSPQAIQNAIRSGVATRVAVAQAQASNPPTEDYTVYGSTGTDFLPMVIAGAAGVAFGAAIMVAALRKRSRA